MKTSNTLLMSNSMLVRMSKKSINQVFAENLAALMERRGLKQVELSAKSGVSQKTVSNYLNPSQRASGAKGKTPSAKLTELAMIAEALEADPWQLLRPLDPDQRRAYEAIEAAFQALQPKAPTPSLVSTAKPPKAANGGSR